MGPMLAKGLGVSCQFHLYQWLICYCHFVIVRTRILEHTQVSTGMGEPLTLGSLTASPTPRSSPSSASSLPSSSSNHWHHNHYNDNLFDQIMNGELMATSSHHFSQEGRSDDEHHNFCQKSKLFWQILVFQLILAKIRFDISGLPTSMHATKPPWVTLGQ